MTTLLESELSPADVPPRKRRVWLRLLVAVVVLVLIGTGTSWLVFINTYQPLTMGNGPFGSITPKTLKTIGDGIQDTNSIVVGQAGTKGTAEYGVSNGGHYAVTLLGIDPNLAALGEVLTWAPIQGRAGEPAGLRSEGRAFPVTLKPGDEVIVEDTVTQPQCPKGNGTEGILSIPIRWSALGIHHVWQLWLQNNGPAVPITACPPKAALPHISND